MDLRNMLVFCGIPYLKNPAGNFLTQLFIDTQGFTGVEDCIMLRIKDVPHMIKDHNSVPNQEALLGDIHQHKLQALVWRAKYFQYFGLAITVATWTTEELMSFST